MGYRAAFYGLAPYYDTNKKKGRVGIEDDVVSFQLQERKRRRSHMRSLLARKKKKKTDSQPQQTDLSRFRLIILKVN